MTSHIILDNFSITGFIIFLAVLINFKFYEAILWFFIVLREVFFSLNCLLVFAQWTV